MDSRRLGIRVLLTSSRLGMESDGLGCMSGDGLLVWYLSRLFDLGSKFCLSVGMLSCCCCCCCCVVCILFLSDGTTGRLALLWIVLASYMGKTEEEDAAAEEPLEFKLRLDGIRFPDIRLSRECLPECFSSVRILLLLLLGE